MDEFGIKIERVVWGFDGKTHKQTIRVFLFFNVNINTIYTYISIKWNERWETGTLNEGSIEHYTKSMCTF